MDSVLRAVITYGFLVLIFRIAGKRTLAQITTFDLVLLLTISEATQQALLANDNSMTNAFLVILTLVLLDIGLSVAKQKWRSVNQLLDNVPLVIVVDGEPIQDRMDNSRVDIDDVLVAARVQRGLERLDQIKYAILERSGGITIIAKPTAPQG